MTPTLDTARLAASRPLAGIVGATLSSVEKNGKMKMVWVGGELQPHPEEQAALAFARELAAQGVSQRQIAAQLEAGGHPRRGQRWHATTVARMLSAHDGPPLCP